jgi:ABC-type antimicrobial peptide transport system permease subunit
MISPPCFGSMAFVPHCTARWVRWRVTLRRRRRVRQPIGIYGVLAYSVARRRRELGIRIAVGALPQAVAMSIIRDGVLITTTGVLLGMAAAYFAAPFVRSLIFGISETDPLVFASVAAFVLILGVGARLLPARRAATVDPVIALRAE